MKSPEISLVVVGPKEDRGEVQFGVFREMCDTLASCLRRVEGIVSRKTHLKYRVVDLNKGSAMLAIEPIPPIEGHDPSKDVVAFFVDTVSSIQAGRSVSPKLTSDDLRVFRKLAGPLNKKAREVKVSGTKLTTQFIANIDKITGVAIPSEGFVKGRLERLNLHNRSFFTIFPPIPGFSIACHFSDEMYEQVYQGINKNVTVFGLLSFRPDRAIPEQVQVKSIEINPEDRDLPQLSAMRGTWSTDGLSAVEFLRALRDE